MNPYDMFESSADLEKGGVWIDYTHFQIKIGRAGGRNSAYTKALALHTKPVKRLIDTDTLSEAKGKEILVNTFADSIILGWKDVTDREGKKLPFNKENVKKLLTDLPDLFRDLQDQSGKMSVFREEAIEGEVKK